MEPLLRLRADAKRSYDQLINAAVMVFSAQGSAATLQAIAKQAGVGIGTLYRHFPDRKSLLEAIYADKLSDLISKAPNVQALNSPDQVFEDWLKMVLDYITRYGGFRDLMILELDDKDSPLVSTGASLLKDGQNSGLLRSDVNIRDLLRLVGAIAITETDQALERRDTLLSVLITGLKSDNQTR